MLGDRHVPRFLLIVLSLGFILPTFAEIQILGKSTVDFEKDVKPILLENCMDCHAAESPQGGLVLNSFKSIVTGGEKSGPSIIFGNGKKSPLIQYLRGELLPRMPAEGDPLSEKQITLISQWIDGLENTKKAPAGYRSFLKLDYFRTFLLLCICKSIYMLMYF